MYLHLFSFLALFTIPIRASAHRGVNADRDQIQAPMTFSKSTVYFGYGSNLWLEQMSLRCPTAKYLGVARLNNYTWIINDRGYANVVESNSTTSPDTTIIENQHVYGLVYSLSQSDEEKLDKNEGVPIAYTKELLSCAFWSAGDASAPLSHHKKVDTSETPRCTRDMLVYIDRKRMTPDEPRKEYIYRMNQGIVDAVKLGVPQTYVDGVMRKYIPGEKDGEDGQGGIGEFARGQAVRFRDESGVF
jgi:gamma-glutamylcyclotransferase